MAKGKNPDLVGEAGSEGTKGHKLIVPLNRSYLVGDLLCGNVTKNTPFLERVVLLERSQLVNHSAGDERSSGNLRVGMV